MTVDNNNRYRAYANYLIALSRLLMEEYPTDSHLAKNISNSMGFKKLSRPNTPINQKELSQILRHAWFTELLLHEKSKYLNLLPFAIPWSMVESYYTVHAVLKAYYLSTGRSGISTHQKALRTIESDICNWQNRFPRPWSSVLSGDIKANPLMISNFQDPITLKNPLNSPYTNDPWQHYGLFLKTTRERKLERCVIEWKGKNNTIRIPSIQRKQIAQSERSTTIFDTLYRIRTRSNYQDVDSFAFCDADIVDLCKLQIAINKIVYETLFVFEMLIARIIGKKDFELMVDIFTGTKLGQAANNTIFQRWDCMKNFVLRK